MSSTSQRTTRIVTIHPRDGYDAPDKRLEAGETVCLVEWEDQDPGYDQPNHWDRRGAYITTSPRSNSSQEERWDGWLGTTSDVCEVACGAWRIVSIQPHTRYTYSADETLYRVRLVKRSDGTA